MKNLSLKRLVRDRNELQTLHTLIMRNMDRVEASTGKPILKLYPVVHQRIRAAFKESSLVDMRSIIKELEAL